jgi:hypothetical protein
VSSELEHPSFPKGSAIGTGDEQLLGGRDGGSTTRRWDLLAGAQVKDEEVAALEARVAELERLVATLAASQHGGAQ